MTYHTTKLKISLEKSAAPYQHHQSYGDSIKKFGGGGVVCLTGSPSYWESELIERQKGGIVGGGLFDYSVNPGPSY